MAKRARSIRCVVRLAHDSAEHGRGVYSSQCLLGPLARYQRPPILLFQRYSLFVSHLAVRAGYCPDAIFFRLDAFVALDRDIADCTTGRIRFGSDVFGDRTFLPDVAPDSQARYSLEYQAAGCAAMSASGLAESASDRREESFHQSEGEGGDRSQPSRRVSVTGGMAWDE